MGRRGTGGGFVLPRGDIAGVALLDEFFDVPSQAWPPKTTRNSASGFTSPEVPREARRAATVRL